MSKWLKISVKAITLGALLVQLGGCGQSPIRNPLAGRQEPKLGALPATKQGSIAQVNWSINALGKQDRFTKLRPFVTQDKIFAADHSGKIVALNKHSGAKLWTHNSGRKFTAGPTLTDNTLLLATTDAKVIALDAASGHELWEAKLSSEVLAPPTGANGTVLVHAIDGSISALAQKTGELRWRVDQSTPSLTLRFSSAPVIANDKVLVGFASGKLLALNLDSGLVEWEKTITLPRGRSEIQRMVDITADPLVSNGAVYVVTYQGKLASLNTDSGNLIWEKEVSSYQNMAMDNTHLYVTDNEHQLWAIDKHTGATMWKTAALGERYITGPAVLDNHVVVADRGGYLHFLQASNGQLEGHLKLGGKFYQNPIGMGKEVLVNSYQGKLAAVHALNGKG